MVDQSDPRFFVLECRSRGEAGRARVRFAVKPDVGSWLSGVRFSAAPAEPLECEWFEGTESGDKLAFYGASPVLMRTEVVEALRAAGVDNLDVYSAVVHSPTGEPDDEGYAAVNIIGLVQAMHREGTGVAPSPGAGPLFDLDIRGLSIDPERAKDFRMFRLAEKVTCILVASSVVEQLQAQGGLGLSFTPPSEWAG